MGTKVASIYAEIGADTSKLEAGLKRTKTELQGTTKEAGLTGLGMAKLAIGGLVAIGAVDKLVGAVKFSIDAFAESQRTMAQTEAVIRSTGGAAGMTAESIGDLANAEAALTGIDDAVVQSGANMLLTFQSIGKDVFPQAMRAVEDMAVAMAGGDASMVDLKDTAIQVGKALEDPINGVTALRRVGVMLTDEQIELVKGFMAVNDKASAQRVILGELNKEFGGSAEMAGSTLSGAFNKLQIASGNLAESLGEKLAPGALKAATALTYLMDRQTSLTQLQNMLSDAQERGLINDTEHMKLVQMTYIGDEGVAKVKQILIDKYNAETEAAKKYGITEAELIRQQKGRYEELIPVIKSAQVETYKLGQTTEANTELWQGSSKAYYDAYYATKKIDDATAALTQRMDDYRTVLEGAIDQELEQFIGKQDELKQKVSELNGKIADIEKKKYLTTSQKKELEELRGELALTNQAVDENADAHEEATKRIMLSMLERKLAVGGMSSEEQSVLDALMVKWGLAGTMTEDTLTGMAQAISENTHEGILDVQGLIEAIGLLLQYNGRVVKLSVVTSYSKLAPPGPPPGPGYTWDGSKWVKTLASGGPVMAGGAYIVGERGPEMFVPSTPGQIVPNNQLGGAGGTDAALLAAILNLPSMISRAVRDGIVRVAG